ncbi:M949_RS01915 family surface polysaccharide biosynthesis protein [Flavobacterium sp. WC2509]|uniref:M949_RS01915 family surface polysaccharide biosynthesis protein n=1 Tax=Flavobacterium sp. WC2509 TaxID=3461406 RepID=UPI004043995D
MKIPNKKKFIFFLVFCSLKIIGQNKIAVTEIDINKIPKEIKYNGKVKNAITWNDKLGENFVLTCETGEFKTKNSENDFRDSEIYAYHYIRYKSVIKQNWKIYDFVKDCSLDIEASFLKNTLTITDLNNDGIGEIWIMYKTACTGDVSPCEMKIIMYQEKQKLAMRGQNRVKVSDKEYDGGKYTFDKAFNEAPNYYRDYAKRLWNKNVNQKWQ